MPGERPRRQLREQRDGRGAVQSRQELPRQALVLQRRCEGERSVVDQYRLRLRPTAALVHLQEVRGAAGRRGRGLHFYNIHNVMSGHFSLKWQVRAAAREQLG